MGHPAAVWDCKAAIEFTKDWNGIDQVILRNPQGASVRVSFSSLSFPLIPIFVVSWIVHHSWENF